MRKGPITTAKPSIEQLALGKPDGPRELADGAVEDVDGGAEKVATAGKDVVQIGRVMTQHAVEREILRNKFKYVFSRFLRLRA